MQVWNRVGCCRGRRKILDAHLRDRYVHKPEGGDVRSCKKCDHKFNASGVGKDGNVDPYFVFTHLVGEAHINWKPQARSMSLFSMGFERKPKEDKESPALAASSCTTRQLEAPVLLEESTGNVTAEGAEDASVLDVHEDVRVLGVHTIEESAAATAAPMSLTNIAGHVKLCAGSQLASKDSFTSAFPIKLLDDFAHKLKCGNRAIHSVACATF